MDGWCVLSLGESAESVLARLILFENEFFTELEATTMSSHTESRVEQPEPQEAEAPKGHMSMKDLIESDPVYSRWVPHVCASLLH